MSICVINQNKDIYSLITCYSCSDKEVIAIVNDENEFVGVYGRKENENVQKIITTEYDISALKIPEVINRNCNVLFETKLIDEEIKIFFEKYSYRYVPILDENYKFIRFEYNPSVVLRKKGIQLQKIAIKYQQISEQEEEIDDLLHCLICNHKINLKIASQKVTQCIFGGGKLVRFICPRCGAIIGPKKMLKLSDEELGQDYRDHYQIFQEGDTTQDEIKTFYQLKPERGKFYLNYGCGGEWSKSLQILNKAGYNVYGYEPYALYGNNEKIITNKKELAQFKFDGIFTNNIIEHLRYPVKELKFMKSLLKNEKCLMAHATPCFEYLHPYTRFHLCFPIKEAADKLFNSIGFEIVERVECNQNGEKYICMIVKQKEDEDRNVWNRV